MINSHIGIFVFQYWISCARVNSVSQFGIKIYKLGTMINSHIGIFVSNIGFHALVSTVSQSWD